MALSEEQKKERSEYLNEHLKITKFDDGKQYVFISYASDNWEVVFKNAIVPLQEKYGMRVYADKAFDHENNNWTFNMQNNLESADVMIAFISQSYIESYACLLELFEAVVNKINVVYVKIGDPDNITDNNALSIVPIEKGTLCDLGSAVCAMSDSALNKEMRALKENYLKNIKSKLENGSLSKYNISKFFNNYFQSAAVNWKTINDLEALKNSIRSASESKNVFADNIENNIADDNIIGKCPVCGKNIYEYEKSFCCKGSKDGCQFKILKHNDCRNKDITADIAKTLLDGKSVLIGKKNNNGSFSKAEFVLDQKTGELIQPVYGKCPKCGKDVHKYEKYFRCSGEDFILWAKSKYSPDFTDDQARELIKGNSIKFANGEEFELNLKTGNIKKILK